MEDALTTDSQQFDPTTHTPSSSPLHVTLKELTQQMGISPDALVVVDQTGNIVMVNEQAAALFGYSPEELREQRLEMLLPERLHEVHTTHREHYFAVPAHPRNGRTDYNCLDDTKMAPRFRWISVCVPCCLMMNYWSLELFVI